MCAIYDVNAGLYEREKRTRDFPYLARNKQRWLLPLGERGASVLLESQHVMELVKRFSFAFQDRQRGKGDPSMDITRLASTLSLLLLLRLLLLLLLLLACLANLSKESTVVRKLAECIPMTRSFLIALVVCGPPDSHTTYRFCRVETDIEIEQP